MRRGFFGLCGLLSLACAGSGTGAGEGGSSDGLIPGCEGNIGDAEQCACIDREGQRHLSAELKDALRRSGTLSETEAEAAAAALTDDQAAELALFLSAVATTCRIGGEG